MIRTAIAGILTLLAAATASAQQFPTVPAQSVIGRMGIPGDTGPSQAIPFKTLAAQIGIVEPATARMWPKQGQSTSPTFPWNAVDPWGNAINCTGTTTQCLQEFITATASNGWPARVYCQGTKFPSGTEPVFINTSSSISVPVAQDWDFEADGTCNLNINVTTTSGLILDSQGASRFIWDGKIVYNVTSPNGNTATSPSCVVLLNPTNPTQDGFAGIYAGLVRIKSPVANPVGGATMSGVICINTAAGSIIQQTLEFSEVNGTNKAYKGILIANASASKGFMQNHIYVNQIHGIVDKAIDEGFASTNQANYNSNLWVVSNIQNTGVSSRGIDTWGSNDIWKIGTINNVQGGLQYGILTEIGANNNQFQYGLISGATTAPVLDTGTCNGIIGAQGGTLALAGTTSGCTKITAPAVASGTVTLPVGGNILTDTSTNTVTNKTLASPAFSGTPTTPTGGAQGYAGATSVSGLALTGQGSVCDINLLNKNLLGALCVITGTANVQVNGSLAIGLTGTATGSAIFQGATSGSLTLQPASGTLGTATLTLPTATDTLVARGTTDTLTNKTFDTAGTGNVFKINGTAITANTGTGSVVLATSPTISQANLVGTTTNDNAAAGSIGEYVSCTATSSPNGSPPTATVTITIASPGVVTWTAHGLTGNSPVVFSTTGALPTGLAINTVYYVVGSSITTNTFQVATTIANAIAGTAINTSGTQSGTQTGLVGVPLTSGTPANICAIQLTAGDWDIRGKAAFTGAAATTVSYILGSLSTTSAALDQGLNRVVAQTYAGATPFATLGTVAQSLGPDRFSLSGTTTIYLVEQSGFGTSTNNGGGFLAARRMR